MSRYDQAFVDMLKKADREPPEKTVRTLDELIEYLLEEDDQNQPHHDGERSR